MRRCLRIPLSIFLSPDPLTLVTSALRPHSQLTQTASPYLLKIYEMTSLCQCAFADLTHTHFLPLFSLSLSRAQALRVLLSSQWLLRCINMAASCLLHERERLLEGERRIRGLMNIFTWVAKSGKEDAWTLSSVRGALVL